MTQTQGLLVLTEHLLDKKCVKLKIMVSRGHDCVPQDLNVTLHQYQILNI